MKNDLIFRKPGTANTNGNENGMLSASSARVTSQTRQSSNGAIIGTNPSTKVVHTINRVDRRSAESRERRYERRSSLGLMHDAKALTRQPVTTNSAKISALFALKHSAPETKIYGSSNVLEVHQGWHEILDVLDEWSKLDDGWDGDDAAPVSHDILDAALAFAVAAENAGIAKPRPYIAADNEIGFIWDGERKASVTFLGTDRFLALCPRDGLPDLRLSGPLDIATSSMSLFTSLRDKFPN